MKKVASLLGFVLFIFIIGCSKDKQMIIDNKWEVESIKVHADSAIQYPSIENIYKLSFRNKKEYNISLDVNSGGGKVKFTGENNVNFEDPWTTFKCCDSKYAEDFVDILIKTETYKMNDSILVLTGEDGELINLKKQ